MLRPQFIVAAVLLAILFGCQPTVTTRAKLDARIDDSYHNSLVDSLDYQGSTTDYDYYRITGPDEATYRVLRQNNDQEDRIPLSSDPGKWRRIR